MSDAEGDGNRLEAEEGGREAEEDREEPTLNTDGSNEASEMPGDSDSGVAGVGVAMGADFVPSADTGSVRPEETASTSAAAEIANEIIRELKLKFLNHCVGNAHDMMLTHHLLRAQPRPPHTLCGIMA